MKKLRIFLLYCHLMTLALIELASSHIIRLVKGQQTVNVKRQ